MLQSFRENSGKWFVKVLFGAIVLSFVIFGIGDVVRNYNATKPVAKVGGVSISYEEFAHAFQKEVSHMQQMVKGSISPEQLQKMGLHTHVLDRLINATLLDLETKNLNILVADSLVRDIIHTMPAFQQGGAFRKELFHELLRHNGFSEGVFIHELKRDMQSRQLLSLGANIQLPAVYTRLLYTLLNQKKVFTTVTIPLEKIKLEKPVSEEELALYFDKNKEAYRQPEFRTVSVVTLNLKDLVKNVPVSDDELKAEYDRRLPEFTQAEKRVVRMLTYPTQALANDALAALKKGRPATAVARDVVGGSLKEQKIEKINLTQSFADAVFQLHAGQCTDVLEMGGGYYIYQVVKIEPEFIKTIVQVSDQLKEDIRLEKSGDFLREFKNKIEDALASGVDFSKVAEENKLPIEVITLDAQGVDPENKLAEKLSMDIKKAILENAFNLAEGKETPILDLDNQVSILVRVDKIAPAFVPELKSIKPRVLQDATSDRKQEEAAKLASKITKEAKNLPDLARLANTYGLTLVSNHTSSLMDAQKAPSKDEKNPLAELLSPELMNKTFQLAVDQADYGLPAKGQGYVVVMLQKILPTPVDEKNVETFTKNLGKMIEKESVSTLMEALRKKYTVVIDEKVINHLLKND
jgi:peptidyl-prolyl cis-trans isomerase D